MDRMREALERAKMLVGMEVDEESAPPPPEEQSFFDDMNRHCTLNNTQRLYGFAICLAAGLTYTFLGSNMTECEESDDLHEKCTKDILSAIKPVENDRNLRLRAIQELKNSIISIGTLKVAAIEPFGSFVSNLYAQSGDLDVSVELCNASNFTTSKDKQDVLKEVCRALQMKGVARDVQLIRTAKVPILQYVSKSFGISFDVSVDNYSGRIKSKVFYWINTLDERFGDMVLLVKEWAKAQDINDAKNGTLNSYSLCLLVVFHFQTCKPAILPPLKEIYDVNIDERTAAHYNEKHLDEVCAANIAKFRRQRSGQRNNSSLSHLLATFFQKVCQLFGFSGTNPIPTAVISTYEGRLKRIQDIPYWMAYALFVEDPFERPENAARAVSGEEIDSITDAFDHAKSVFVLDGPAQRNELLSLLCTPEVGRKLGVKGMAKRYRHVPM